VVGNDLCLLDDKEHGLAEAVDLDGAAAATAEGPPSVRGRFFGGGGGGGAEDAT